LQQVGFITRMYRDAQSTEHKMGFVTCSFPTWLRTAELQIPEC